jgi:gluconokinase
MVARRLVATIAPNPKASVSDILSPRPFPPVVVMGVSGSGKSTVGELLASVLGAPFVDADDLHPEANRLKMAEGHPLDDDDRAPWLRIVADRIGAAGDGSVVVACSALKRRYRDVLRDGDPRLLFVHLTGVHELVERRQRARKGHFMPSGLMRSQFAALEPLGDDEAGFGVDVDATPEQIVDAVVAQLERVRDAPENA